MWIDQYGISFAVVMNIIPKEADPFVRGLHQVTDYEKPFLYMAHRPHCAKAVYIMKQD